MQGCSQHRVSLCTCQVWGCVQELAPADVAEATAFGVLSSLANALLSVQPLRVPGFAFPWLELISHRCLLGGPFTFYCAAPSAMISRDQRSVL